jgi:hypothetical protein
LIDLLERTRTLLTEIDMNNRRGRSWRAALWQVSPTFSTTPSVEIPAEALVMKGGIIVLIDMESNFLYFNRKRTIYETPLQDFLDSFLLFSSFLLFILDVWYPPFKDCHEPMTEIPLFSGERVY